MTAAMTQVPQWLLHFLNFMCISRYLMTFDINGIVYYCVPVIYVFLKSDYNDIKKRHKNDILMTYYGLLFIIILSNAFD